MIRNLSLAALAATLALAGCSAAPANPATGTAPVAARASDPSRLTQAEIEATPGLSTAFDAVQRLRPAWLRATGARSDGQILVFQNTTRMGTADALRQISIEVVGSMRYLDSVDANNQLAVAGMGPVAGAIIVSTRGR
ncbi:MAG TPA: hypothetical protein VF665_12545 [Longimicrobium sp.]|jgi:hypothetical protein|uniref:hypothetical protein n=1 Tax=Longimicrobium sp. TaxID=2029185 RepID=UPI002ED7BF91